MELHVTTYLQSDLWLALWCRPVCAGRCTAHHSILMQTNLPGFNDNHIGCSDPKSIKRAKGSWNPCVSIDDSDFLSTIPLASIWVGWSNADAINCVHPKYIKYFHSPIFREYSQKWRFWEITACDQDLRSKSLARAKICNIKIHTRGEKVSSHTTSTRWAAQNLSKFVENYLKYFRTCSKGGCSVVGSVMV